MSSDISDYNGLSLMQQQGIIGLPHLRDTLVALRLRPSYVFAYTDKGIEALDDSKIQQVNELLEQIIPYELFDHITWFSKNHGAQVASNTYMSMLAVRFAQIKYKEALNKNFEPTPSVYYMKYTDVDYSLVKSVDNVDSSIADVFVQSVTVMLDQNYKQALERLLDETSPILKDILNFNGYLARVGGDEFKIITEYTVRKGLALEQIDCIDEFFEDIRKFAAQKTSQQLQRCVAPYAHTTQITQQSDIKWLKPGLTWPESQHIKPETIDSLIHEYVLLYSDIGSKDIHSRKGCTIFSKEYAYSYGTKGLKSKHFYLNYADYSYYKELIEQVLILSYGRVPSRDMVQTTLISQIKAFIKHTLLEVPIQEKNFKAYFYSQFATYIFRPLLALLDAQKDENIRFELLQPVFSSQVLAMDTKTSIETIISYWKSLLFNKYPVKYQEFLPIEQSNRTLESKLQYLQTLCFMCWDNVSRNIGMESSIFFEYLEQDEIAFVVIFENKGKVANSIDEDQVANAAFRTQQTETLRLMELIAKDSTMLSEFIAIYARVIRKGTSFSIFILEDDVILFVGKNDLDYVSFKAEIGWLMQQTVEHIDSIVVITSVSKETNHVLEETELKVILPLGGAYSDPFGTATISLDTYNKLEVIANLRVMKRWKQVLFNPELLFHTKQNPKAILEVKKDIILLINTEIERLFKANEQNKDIPKYVLEDYKDSTFYIILKSIHSFLRNSRAQNYLEYILEGRTGEYHDGMRFSDLSQFQMIQTQLHQYLKDVSSFKEGYAEVMDTFLYLLLSQTTLYNNLRLQRGEQQKNPVRSGLIVLK
jgi:hypothetical protein